MTPLGETRPTLDGIMTKETPFPLHEAPAHNGLSDNQYQLMVLVRPK